MPLPDNPLVTNPRQIAELVAPYLRQSADEAVRQALQQLPQSEEEYVGTARALAIIGKRSRKSLERLRKAGRVRANNVGRHVYYSAADLRALKRGEAVIS